MRIVLSGVVGGAVKVHMKGVQIVAVETLPFAIFSDSVVRRLLEHMMNRYSQHNEIAGEYDPGYFMFYGFISAFGS